MSNLRIGLVGCGMIGRLHAGLISGIESVELAAVADTDPEKAGELKKTYGCAQYCDYTDMLKNENIDIVSICVPPSMHCRVAIDAARAGSHVVVEKPMDTEPARASLMIGECRKYGVKMSVIFQHRFDDVFMILKKAIDDGRLGRLLMGISRTMWYRDAGYYAGGMWRGTRENGGGALMNQSIHYIDMLQYLLGDVDSASGLCGTLLHKQIGAEDTGIAAIRFKNGAMGMVAGTTIAYPGICSELEIYGENGTVLIKNDKLAFCRIKDGSIPELDKLLEKACASGAAASRPEDLDMESHKRQYEDMIAAVRENRDPLVTGEEGRKSIELINAIYRSSIEGRWIKLSGG